MTKCIVCETQYDNSWNIPPTYCIVPLTPANIAIVSALTYVANIALFPIGLRSPELHAEFGDFCMSNNDVLEALLEATPRVEIETEGTALATDYWVLDLPLATIHAEGIWARVRLGDDGELRIYNAHSHDQETVWLPAHLFSL